MSGKSRSQQLRLELLAVCRVDHSLRSACIGMMLAALCEGMNAARARRTAVQFALKLHLQRFRIRSGAHASDQVQPGDPGVFNSRRCPEHPSIMGSVDSGQQRDRDRSSAFEYLLCYSSLIAAKPAVRDSPCVQRWQKQTSAIRLSAGTEVQTGPPETGQKTSRQTLHALSDIYG